MSGSVKITLIANDNSGGIATFEIAVAVTLVDDAPSFTAVSRPSVIHMLGRAPVALSAILNVSGTDLVDKDTFNASGVACEAQLVAGSDVATPDDQDELVVLPASGISMASTSSGYNLLAGTRVIATTTTNSVRAGNTLRLLLASTSTADDQRYLPACLAYRNTLGRSGTTTKRRAAIRFVGPNSGNTTTVDVQMSASDPPVVSTVSDMQVAPLRSAVLTHQHLETRNTGSIKVVIPPQFGRLLRGTTVLGGDITFTQAEIDAGLISYTHTNANAAFDQFTLQPTGTAGLTTTVTMQVRVSQLQDQYHIISDPPMLTRMGDPVTIILGVAIPLGATMPATWDNTGLVGPATLLWNRAANSVTITPTATGRVDFDVLYRQHTAGPLTAPTFSPQDPLARQHVQMLVIPALTPALAGGG